MTDGIDGRRTTQMGITKTDFMRGMQCPKMLWLDKHKPKMKIIPPEIQAMLAHAREINCPACEGLVDWKKLKEAADANGCQAYIVEREYSAGDRIEMLTEDIRRYREVI